MKLENDLRRMKTKRNIPKLTGCRQNGAQREIYISKCLYIRRWKIPQINNLNFYLKKLEKEE